MATLAFDSLQFARRLKAVGVPEMQAEVQAELMAEAFGFYADNIVTRDYLDATLRASFAEQDARWDRKFAELSADWDRRFAELGGNWDGKFAELSARWDQKFSELSAGWDRKFELQNARWDKKFAEHDARFSVLEQQLAQLDAKFERRFLAITGQLRLLAFMIGGTWLLVGLPLLQDALGR